jgi:DNA polymerase-3 subunit epsilon
VLALWIEQRTPVLAESLVVLDFETTGLRSDHGDRVTEIAALRIRGNSVVERFETLVNCDMRVPAYITGYTGITQAMVDGALDGKLAFQNLLNFIGTDAVIAHNAAFDQGFLDSECKRLGLPHQVPEFICSVRIARRLFPLLESHALGCLALWLGLPFTPGAHRAGIDAAVTANILLRCCERIRSRYRVSAVTANMLRQFASEQANNTVASAA